MTSLSPPIPAFGFDSPWLLTGLVLAAIPILIHLFFRRPHREIPWAATRFLLAATRKQAPRIRLEQWILLAVRVLLLILVVLALARPRDDRAGAPRATNTKLPPGRQIILVLDASYGMAHAIDGESRFDRARAALQEVIDSAQAGDSFQLVRMTNIGQKMVISEPSFQASAVSSTLAEQEISFGRATPLETLQAIESLLESNVATGPREVVIASDFQQIDWRPTNATRGAWQRVIQSISQQASIVLADVARASADNQTVTSLELDGSFLRTGQVARFSSLISRSAAEPLRNQRVELFIDGLPSGTETFSLAPNQQTTVSLQDMLGEPGEHAVETRIPPDALAIDNSRFLAITVKDQLRVLLVDGKFGAPAQQSSTYFLERALAPRSTDSANNESDFLPTVIGESELPAMTLRDFDAVVLSNLEWLTEREIRRLRAFVEAGGGLMIALGDQIRPEAYNRVLGGPEGLLPVTFQTVQGNPDNPEQAIAFSTATLEHPIVLPFAGNPGTGLETDFVLAYSRISIDPRASVARVLDFESGDPAIVAEELGMGRVVLLTTSVDLSWAGPWPQIGRSYLPLIHEMLRFAATGSQSARRVRVGEPLVWRIAERIPGLEVQLRGPGEFSRDLPLRVTPNGSEVRFDETMAPGVYTFTIGAPLHMRQMFAVNVDPAEGDLTPLSVEERDSLLPGTMARDASDLTSTASPLAHQWPWSRWLLAATLALLLTEQVMAWRFTHGLTMLLGMIGLFVAFGIWENAPIWGWAVGLLWMGLLALWRLLPVVLDRRGRV